jgi:multidrug resistance efflux pump
VKHIFPALVVVAAIAVGFYFYWTYGRETQPFASAVLAADSELDAEAAATARDGIFLMGVAVPVQHAALTMGVSGKIAEVFVREGDTVNAGQVIAHLENANAQVAIKQAQAHVDAAEADLAKLQAGPQQQEIVVAESAVTVAVANLTKVTDQTQAVGGATPNNAIDKTIAEADLQRAQAQLELLQNGSRPEDIAAAEAAVAEAEAELESKQLDLISTELRAPFTGTVSSMNLRVGEQVGTSEVIVQLADLNHWQIESNELDEISVVRVKVGDPVQIVFDALPDVTLTGKVTHITPFGVATDNEITYSVIVEPDGFDPNIRWNMIARLIISPGG